MTFQAELVSMLRHARKAVVLIAIGLAIAGCASHKHSAKQDPFAGKGSPIYPGKGPVPWGGGKYFVGKPYQVAGRTFTPREQPGYDKKGLASWYGEDFNRRKTSNGEWFDMNRLTAAHATLPLPSYVKVTNLDNGREVVVRVNDRGPFVDTRVIDLSKRTAEVLEFKNKGKTQVRVQYIGPAPLKDNGGKHLVAMNTELERGTPMRKMIAHWRGQLFRPARFLLGRRQCRTRARAVCIRLAGAVHRTLRRGGARLPRSPWPHFRW